MPYSNIDLADPAAAWASCTRARDTRLDRTIGSPRDQAGTVRSVLTLVYALVRCVVLLHAISDDARRFYEKAGFSPSPVDPMTMMITLADIEKALAGL